MYAALGSNKLFNVALRRECLPIPATRKFTNCTISFQERIFLYLFMVIIHKPKKRSVSNK